MSKTISISGLFHSIAVTFGLAKKSTPEAPEAPEEDSPPHMGQIYQLSDFLRDGLERTARAPETRLQKPSRPSAKRPHTRQTVFGTMPKDDVRNLYRTDTFEDIVIKGGLVGLIDELQTRGFVDEEEELIPFFDAHPIKESMTGAEINKYIEVFHAFIMNMRAHDKALSTELMQDYFFYYLCRKNGPALEQLQTDAAFFDSTYCDVPLERALMENTAHKGTDPSF